MKFNIGFDKVMVQNLISSTEQSCPNHHEMYSDCYLMKVPIPD